MNEDEATALITLVKGNWYKQPTDDLTIRMWTEILKPIEMGDAWDAVMTMARAGAPEPPTPGQIFEAAREYEGARHVRVGGGVAGLLEGPEPVPQEEARQILRDLLQKLEEKHPRRAQPLPTGFKYEPKKTDGDE